MKTLLEHWRRYLTEEITTEEEAAQWLAKQITPLMAAADAGNYTKPLQALVARLNSPDGMSPMVRGLLASGDRDEDPSDEAVNVSMGVPIPAPNLIPTQGVIDLFKSVGFNGSHAQSLRKVIDGVSGAPPILAAGAGGKFYIIDGHHRWSGATVFNVNCKIPANVINMDPGKALLLSQLAIAAYVGSKKIPSASAKKGRSIIGPGAMSSSQVNQLLLKSVGKVIDPNAGGTFMNSKVLAVIMNTGYGQGKVNEVGAAGAKLGKRKEKIVRGACAKIAQNCGILAKKYSSEGPPREIMPQFEPKVGGPDFKKVKPDIEAGKINFKPSFLGKGDI